MLNPLSILHSGEPSWLLEPFSWIKKLSKWNPVESIPTDCAEGSQTWGHLVVWLWIIGMDPTTVSVDNLLLPFKHCDHLDLLDSVLGKKKNKIYYSPQNGGEICWVKFTNCWEPPRIGFSQDPLLGDAGSHAPEVIPAHPSFRPLPNEHTHHTAAPENGFSKRGFRGTTSAIAAAN